MMAHKGQVPSHSVYSCKTPQTILGQNVPCTSHDHVPTAYERLQGIKVAEGSQNIPIKREIIPLYSWDKPSLPSMRP